MNAMVSCRTVALGAGIWMATAALAGSPSDGPAAAEPATAMAPLPEQRAAERSALWRAVSAQSREPGGAEVEPQRRLNAEQLLELREQIRRASVMWPVSAPPSSP